MKQYKVYKHPSGVTEAVKQGWSWPSFFFGAFWAMAKKMWVLGGGVLFGFLVLAMLVGAVGSGSGLDTITNVVAIIAAFFFGVNGNSWRETNLASRGFEQVDTVTAATPEGAIALYLKGVNRAGN